MYLYRQYKRVIYKEYIKT